MVSCMIKLYILRLNKFHTLILVFFCIYTAKDLREIHVLEDNRLQCTFSFSVFLLFCKLVFINYPVCFLFVFSFGFLFGFLHNLRSRQIEGESTNEDDSKDNIALLTSVYTL